MPPHGAKHSTDTSLVVTTPFTSDKPFFLSQISQYLLVELDSRRADITLIVCGFVSGLVDGLSFNAWGSFSSMQTGVLFKFRYTNHLL